MSIQTGIKSYADLHHFFRAEGVLFRKNSHEQALGKRLQKVEQ